LFHRWLKQAERYAPFIGCFSFGVDAVWQNRHRVGMSKIRIIHNRKIVSARRAQQHAPQQFRLVLKPYRRVKSSDDKPANLPKNTDLAQLCQIAVNGRRCFFLVVFDT
jgi:hypothetical protein